MRHLWSGTWPDDYCIRCEARPPDDANLNAGELVDDPCPGYPDLYTHWYDENGEHQQAPYSVHSKERMSDD
jgi:hypothetical protein